MGWPGGSDGKESACSEGDLGLIPGLGRSPGGGHGNSLQYSCLENPHGQRSLAGYSPWGLKELDTTERLHSLTHHPQRSSCLFVIILPTLPLIVLCLVAQSCPTLCDPLPGSSVHGDSPGKNTRVGCHALLQGIFPTQGSLYL